MIRLFVADDHTVIRKALCEMLEKKGEYQVVGQASNGEEALALIQNCHPDLIILDIQMPKLNGIEALKKLNEGPSAPPVVILSANDNETSVRAALQAGARGFLPKNVKEEELEFAIKSVIKGQTYLSPAVTSQLMSYNPATGTLDDPLAVLTKREREILGYLAQGQSNREIGKMLHISVRTVDTHRSNILKKLSAKNNADLTRLAISAGLVNL